MQLVLSIVPLLFCGLPSTEARRRKPGKGLFGKSKPNLPRNKLPGISMPSLDLSRIGPPKIKVPIIGRLQRPNIRKAKPPSVRLPFFLRPKKGEKPLTPAGSPGQPPAPVQPARNPTVPPSMGNPSQSLGPGQPPTNANVPQAINAGGHPMDLPRLSRGGKLSSLESMEHSLENRIHELDEILKAASLF